MADLRYSARVYIGLLLLLAVTLLAVTLHREGSGGGTMQLLLALAFTIFMTLASTFPLHFAHKTKLTLDTSVVFAAVLLFEPGVAMLIVGTGHGLAEVIRREPWYQALFNSSQSMVQAGVGGVVLALSDWRYEGLQLGQPDRVVLVVTVAVTIFLVNTIAVAIIVGLQSSVSPLRVWVSSIRFGVPEELALLALGLLGALVVDVYPWALPILLLPAVVVYRSLDRFIQLREQTLDALDALADVIDLRDPYTANHSRRVAHYSRELATRLELDPDEVDLIERVARVHDIGKMVVDRQILTKVGKLDASEWSQLKQHPVTGAEILSSFPLFALGTSYARHHHERIDGQGYPDGIAGEHIPLGARIIAVADSLDAMANDRPYRSGLAPNVVLEEFHEQRGIQWDAAVVDALFELIADGRIVLGDASAAPIIWDRHGHAVPQPVLS